MDRAFHHSANPLTHTHGMYKANYSLSLHKARSRAAALLLACLLSSCGNDIEKTRIFEPRNLPASTIVNAHIRRSENGSLQLLMEAPIVRQYGDPESKTVYPQGVRMRFFDGEDRPTGILTANYAVQYDKRQIVMVRDSVVIIDLQNGDTVYLKDLIWRQAEHRIFSNNPLRSKNGPRITLGDRFESDDSFKQPHIIHQRGTLEWKEE